MLPPSISFGTLDSILLREPGPLPPQVSATLIILKWTNLKDRKACQVADGGSAYAADTGVETARTCRLILRAKCADKVALEDGCVIRVSELTLHTLKTGEKIIDAAAAELLPNDFVDINEFYQHVDRHPLCFPTEDGQPHQIVSRGPPSRPEKQLRREEPTKSEAPNFGEDRRDDQDQWNAAEGRYGDGRRDCRNNVPARSENGRNEVNRGETSRVGTRAGERQMGARPGPYTAGKPVEYRHEQSFLKIDDLSHYVDKWRIKARVTAKSDIVQYNNVRGLGKLFSIELLDADGGEIRATFFNDGVEKFHPLIQIDGVYTFSKGSVKAANAKFNKSRHKYEITFGADAEIQGIDGDARDIPKQSFLFKPLAGLEQMQSGESIDVVAIAVKVMDTNNITIRSTGAQKEKRNLTIMDVEGSVCDMTIWGSSLCALFDPEEPGLIPFMVVKRAVVDDYNGRRLQSSQSCSIDVFWYDEGQKRWKDSTSGRLRLEDLPELEALHNFYFNQGGRNIQPVTRSIGKEAPRANISEIIHSAQKISTIDSADSAMYFTLVANVIQIHVSVGRKFFWTACPTCNKKVTALDDDMGSAYAMDPFAPPAAKAAQEFYCSNCSKNVDKPERKYNLSLDIQDHTETLRCSILGDAGVTLIGVPANEVEDARANPTGGKDWLDYFNRVRRLEYRFKVVAKPETWQDDTRIRYRIVTVEAMESVVGLECRQLISQLTEKLDSRG